MKTTLITVAAVVLLATISFGDLHRIDIAPYQVPDETEPRVNYGDAPPGYGPDSWQGPATGKTNWHARYLADGDYLSALFPEDAATLTIADLAEISYYTKRPGGTPAGRDWWIQVETRPVGSSWFGYRFINNYDDHTSTDVWSQYSTGDADWTFRETTMNGAEQSFAQFKAAYGSHLVDMISVQTGSAWNGFDGYMDGIEITLTNGNIGQVNFVPVPVAVVLGMLGLGVAGLKLRKYV